MVRIPLLRRRQIVIALLAAGIGACGGASAQPGHANETPPSEVGALAPSGPAAAAASSSRDLAADEAMGGHTLARHVGRTDADLVERLRREPQISAASTYTDRRTAEEVVGAALESGGRPLAAWRSRSGRRPNFVVHYPAHRIVGRSVHRGRTAPTPCDRALIVLRWDERRDRFYVLTSYPEDRP